MPQVAQCSKLPPIDEVRGVRAARVAHMGGDHAREAETLRQMVSSFPEDLSARFALLQYHEEHASSAEEQQAQRNELTATLVRTATQAPLDVLALLASRYDDSETLARVADELERRVAGPQSAHRATLETLIELRLRQKETFAATETLEKLLALHPNDFNRRRLLQLYRHDERWQDAADLVKAWLATDPGMRTTYIGLLSHLGHLDELDRQLEMLLDQSSQLPLPERQRLHETVRNAAWTLRDSGRDIAAEKLFRRVVDLDPTDEEATSALLRLYGSEQDLQRLKSEQAAKWDAEVDPQALFDEGTLRLSSGDAETAFPLLQRAAPELPALEPAWYNLGMAAYRLENWTVVVEAFEHAAQLNDSRSQTYLYRGLALEKLGRCNEAVTDLERALVLDPSYTTAHYYLAFCYSKLARPDDAARHRELYEATQTGQG